MNSHTNNQRIITIIIILIIITNPPGYPTQPNQCPTTQPLTKNTKDQWFSTFSLKPGTRHGYNPPDSAEPWPHRPTPHRKTLKTYGFSTFSLLGPPSPIVYASYLVGCPFSWNHFCSLDHSTGFKIQWFFIIFAFLYNQASTYMHRTCRCVGSSSVSILVVVSIIDYFPLAFVGVGMPDGRYCNTESR